MKTPAVFLIWIASVLAAAIPLQAQETTPDAGATDTGETASRVSTPPKSSVTLRLELWDALQFTDDETLTAGTGSAELIYRPGANDRVKGELKLKFFPADGTPEPVSVEKCFVRVRFGETFLTMGKTRLSWGEGRLFNAGDLLYGSLNPLVDLTAEDLRTETAWLTAASVPLWRGAFAEAVWMPPEPDPADGSMGPLGHSRAGGRLYWTPGRFKLEAGYLYRGVSDERPGGHNVTLSLHGVLGIDWYAAGSMTLGDNETLALSAGVYHMIVVNTELKMTFRLEALALPFAVWQADEAETLATAGEYYGLYLYPEVTLLAGDSATFLLSSVISPIDGSAMITAGGGWNIFQGLTLMLYGTVLAGEDNDIFNWNSTTVTAGARYVF